ncbi:MULTISPECIES: glycoside hydrolase family 105 protein [unclassified Roseateles]|uniref:glycoside hydrolase family 88/105 protein n=1 Tax=unclassified Roseateles TaxID=2626991 RepID=UPI0006FEB292|nr:MULTISPECIES: glycoside hydrolase family 88 protein [unclassified Roseateles]
MTARGDLSRALHPKDCEFDPSALPAPARVQRLLEQSASVEIARLTEQPLHIPPRPGRGISANWIAATFLIGLGRLARVSSLPHFHAYLRSVAEHYNFGLLGAWSAHNMLDADNIAMGEVYLELYARSGEPGELAPLQARLAYTLPYLQLEPKPDKLVWWWCDALFMAPPVYARAAALTRDPRYLRAVDVQWWRVHDRLWSSSHGLFFRDERFLTRKTRHGRPVFWGRGNGWVVAGLARLIEALPSDWPTRPRYIEVFRSMMASIAALQREDGCWTTSLLDPQDPPGAESTASAFFAYALAWGINHGLLERQVYLPHATRAWAGLAGLMQPNGLLGFAQKAGDQPEPAGANDHQLYGTGGLLLAGLEVMRLGTIGHPLPAPEPARDAPGPVRLPIRDLPRPTDGDPARLRNWERAMAERQAMLDLAFVPKADGR